MNRKIVKAGFAAALAGAVLVVQAADHGTSAEAKAMLDRAVAAVKANKARALEMFSKGEGGFKEKDLYPFCGGPDGMYTATPNPALTGTSMRAQKDKVGRQIGQEFYQSAEGKVSEIAYMWPRPGTTEPAQKVTYCTKVTDQICCVGFWTQP
jgi:hypothetical protein